jgi:hypothetical protein
MKPILSIILVSFSSIVYSQDFKIGFQTGFGLYRMGELKELNSSFFGNLPFQAKVISNYPGYFYYSPTILLSLNKFNVGLKASFNSTGSRISSKDYSGEYTLDSKIRCITPNVYGDFSLFSVYRKFRILIYSEVGMVFSKLALKENLTLNDQVLIDSLYVYKSKNYCVESGLILEYKICQFINFGLNTGYLGQFGKDVLKTNKSEALKDDKNTISPDWRGFRCGLRILVSFPLRNDK